MSIDSILIVLTSPQRGGSMYAANDRPVWCRGPPPPRRPYCLSLIFMLAHLKSQRNPSVFNLLDLVPTLFITIYFILNNL